jgi:hypothetical protein
MTQQFSEQKHVAKARELWDAMNDLRKYNAQYMLAVPMSVLVAAEKQGYSPERIREAILAIADSAPRMHESTEELVSLDLGAEIGRRVAATIHRSQEWHRDEFVLSVVKDCREAVLNDYCDNRFRPEREKR